MPKIWLDHADGHYSTRLLTDEEASKDEAEDQRAVYVQDAVYEAPALKAGEYTFYCSVHPTMTGTLTVQ